MGLCYANPPFAQLAKMLTTIAFEEARVILCTPDWGTTWEHAFWRRLLDRMTVGRTERPNGPAYVPEDSWETMPAPEWGSLLSIVDGSPNPVPVSDFLQVVLKALMAENRGPTLQDLKKKYEYAWVTTKSGECSDEQGTPAVSTPLAEPDDRLSDFASAIPPVVPEVLTRKHSNFLAQLPMDEMDLRESTLSLVTTPFSPCRPQIALQVRYLALNPHPTTCPFPGTTYRISSRFYGLRLRLSSDGPSWTSSRGPGKRQ